MATQDGGDPGSDLKHVLMAETPVVKLRDAPALY